MQAVLCLGQTKGVMAQGVPNVGRETGEKNAIACFICYLILTRYERQMNDLRVHTTKTLTKTCDYWLKNNLWCWEENLKNRRKQNIKEEANNVQLDNEDTQRSKLNSHE